MDPLLLQKTTKKQTKWEEVTTVCPKRIAIGNYFCYFIVVSRIKECECKRWYSPQHLVVEAASQGDVNHFHGNSGLINQLGYYSSAVEKNGFDFSSQNHLTGLVLSSSLHSQHKHRQDWWVWTNRFSHCWSHLDRAALQRGLVIIS